MPYNVQGIDLPGIFNAAQQARMNELRMQEMQRQQQIAAQLPQAREAYFGGNPALLQRLAPDEFEKMRGLEIERARSAAQLELNQRNAERDEAYRREQLKNATLDEDARWVVNARGLVPGTPQFQKEYEARRRARLAEDERLAKARAVNVNVGEKTLPTTVVQESADAQTALQILDDMGTSFKDNVPSSTFFSQLKARGQQFVPNTSTANYLTDAAGAAQVVGTFLEGGKLGEADLPRYKAMLPQPGDDEKTAARKLDNLRRKIRLRAANRTEALKGAGYRTPQTTGNPELPPIPPGNPVGDVSFAGQQLPPPPLDAQRREPPPQGAPIDMNAPAAQAPGRVAPFELPQSVQAPLDLSGASGPQAMPGQQGAVRRDPGGQVAQPGQQAQQEDFRSKVARITAQGLAGGKTPDQIADELVRAGMPRAQREQAIKNIHKQRVKRAQREANANGG